MREIASIRKRGKDSYQITVSVGVDELGNRKRFCKTVRRDPGLTDKEWEKELSYMAASFEKSVRDGMYYDSSKITLNQFVEIWRKDYAGKYLAPKTLLRYEGLLARILPALGHLKLCDIRPIHLHRFYNNLRELGIKNDARYYPTEAFIHYISQMKAKDFADQAKINIKTARTIMKGAPTNKAVEICKAMELDISNSFIQKNQSALGDRTILHHHRLINSILEKAVKWQILPDNPARKVEAPKVKEKKDTPHFTEEDLPRLFSLLDRESIKHQAWIYVAIFCGCRLGELGGLEWKDVDFENNTITIREALQSLPGYGTFIKDTKNETSARIVAMPQIAMDVLQEYKEWQDKQKEIMGDLWTETGMVFTQNNGKLMYEYTPSQWFTKFRRKHGIPDVPFHGLRHTNASLLIGEGIDVRTVSGRLGHARPTTTMDIYAHFLRRPDKVAAVKLDDKYRELRDDSLAKTQKVAKVSR